MRLITAFILGLFYLSNSYGDGIYGRVISISDGDTISILDNQNKQFKIRLTGIDAPEKKQPFGQKSKASLSQLIFNKYVVAECNKQDRFKRYLCKIKFDNVDINLELIKLGMAWHYKQYDKDLSELDRQLYKTAEDFARLKNVGLWVDSNPTPPWEWRRLQKVSF